MDAVFYILLGLAIGAILGGAIGWLAGLRRAGTAPPDTRMEGELRQQLAQRESSLAQLREQFAQVNMANATAKAEKTATETMLVEQRQLHEQALKDARQAQEKAIAELREQFQLLSTRALEQTHPEFLRLANETLAKFQEAAKGDLEKRQESIKTLVEP